MRRRAFILALTALLGASPPRFKPAVPRERLRGALQEFATRMHQKAFRHLGDERDFDHGHFLFRPGESEPFALLYHTQELARYHSPNSGYGWLDPEGRNWIQWLGDGRIENARRYERRGYPSSGSWPWFVSQELPGLRAHRTILDKMLDPARLGAASLSSRQVVFTRVPCAGSRRLDGISIALPGQAPVCLALSAY